MSALDAAVRAVAEALDDALVVLLGKRLPTYPTALAGDLIAALATSADVRAGLVAEVASRVRWSDHDHTPRPCCTEAIVGAVLAALGGAG